jgi:putative Holliday junction resolvase
MQKNILSLDLGKGSLGLATSRSGILVTLLPNLRFKAGDYDEALRLLQKAVEKEVVEHIAIGWPLFPSGDPCEMTPIVERLIPKVQSLFPGVEIVKVDERNSTVEAASYLHESGENMEKQRRHIDSVAASVILERYLKQIGQA